MKIQVLGSGCPNCKTLYELTKTAVAELGIKAEIEYSTDISKIIEMGVMQAPVLAIDGKPVMVGTSGNVEKIKEIINANIGSNLKKEDRCCSDKNTCDIKCKSSKTKEKTCSCGGNC